MSEILMATDSLGFIKPYWFLLPQSILRGKPSDLVTSHRPLPLVPPQFSPSPPLPFYPPFKATVISYFQHAYGPSVKAKKDWTWSELHTFNKDINWTLWRNARSM